MSTLENRQKSESLAERIQQAENLAKKKEPPHCSEKGSRLSYWLSMAIIGSLIAAACVLIASGLFGVPVTQVLIFIGVVLAIIVFVALIAGVMRLVVELSR